MPNKLIIDKTTLSDPEVLADCKVGDSKELTVEVTVTRDDSDIFEADVTDIEYSSEAGSQAAAPDTGAPQTKAPKPAPAPPMGGATGY